MDVSLERDDNCGRERRRGLAVARHNVTANDFALQVEGLYLTKSGRPVLNDINLNLPRATCTTIVGPSGAGKTSLLRCMNGLDRPERGRVLLDGEDIRALPPTQLRRRVGMLLQVPVVFAGSILDNLLYEVDGDHETARRALAQAGLNESFLDRAPGALSVGEAQRLCIARALTRAPEVLLLDEPTHALDRNATSLIERTVATLVDDEGLTVVFVTHDLAQAQRVGHLCVALANGVVRYRGPAADVELVWEEHST